MRTEKSVISFKTRNSENDQEVFSRESSPVIKSRIGDLEAQNTQWKDEDYEDVMTEVKIKVIDKNKD